ncbi:TonB-dependent receptor [Candidatus Methylopumilus universalis]|uniref:TonB-dependent receptor n=1 Tax=Candidatus Methylopumilus universalis TaxID=2588536 RepID=UPI00111FE1F1|nr:TonB-dependent receptor [Candidatus Methylopumilus universalis]QDC46265.1 TonB-dependent receptor [Candidatus Methylopumilus universalis]
MSHHLQYVWTNLMKLKISAIVALALASSASLGAAEKMTTGTINVISTTPLPSIGLPLNIIPANIQIFDSKDLRNQPGVTFADQLMNNAQGITFNEIQGNPWQPDVSFRGFSASPLAGTPQGMSVFVDGVRVNEPFGDTVHWDLVPNFAIQGMQVVPGSNPVYGLNTLGGAIALQTKDGRNNQGAALEAEAGSWGRKRALAQFGGVSKDGSVDYFLGTQHTTEDGWRKYSPSHINQTFGKIGWQNEKTKINLSYMGAYNNMTGNGLTPIDMLGGNRDDIHTSPDVTKNYLNHFALNGSHWLSNDVMLSGNAYYRTSNRNTLNGDANDDFDDGQFNEDTELCTGENDDCSPGVMNRSRLKSRSLGFNMQAAFNQPIWNMKNQFIAGVGYDLQRTKFYQTEQFTNVGSTELDDLGAFGFDSRRSPANLDDDRETTVNLGGRSRTASIFATDTLSINQYWHVTASARYNHTKVKNRDHLNPSGSDESLSGDHNFNRVNPSLGLTFTPTETLSVFGSYSESNRAPTSIELGCANPEVPCKLPNAMASDPPLNQVVAKTYDAGLRGKISDNFKWNASVYRTMNHDDIHFINSSTQSGALGYFDNVGRTKRQGLDLGLSGTIDKFFFRAGYSFISAKYDSDLTLINEINSESIEEGDGAIINARKGNYLAGIPKHQFKLRAQYEITPQWLVGSNVVYYAKQFVQGNENNAHNGSTSNCTEDGNVQCPGKLSGYAVVNLDTQYNVGQGWRVFAKAVNIFDKDYYTGGRLAETMFTPAGAWSPDDRGVTAVVPGAPRAAWIGVRYEFGGAPEAK